MTVVVSNTSPIINLAMIGQLHLLDQLYHHIFIPEGVYYEVVIRGQWRPGSQEVQNFQWIEKQRLKMQNQ